MLLTVVTGLLFAAAPGTTAPTPAAADAPAVKPEEKKICRKEVETGSLIKGRKVCYTAKQWQKLADASRDEVERTTGSGSQSGQ